MAFPRFTLEHWEEKARAETEWQKEPSEFARKLWKEAEENREFLRLLPIRQRWPQMSRCYDRLLSDPARFHEAHGMGSVWECHACTWIN